MEAKVRAECGQANVFVRLNFGAPMASGGRVELDADRSIVASLEYLTQRDGSIGRGEVVGEQGRGLSCSFFLSRLP